MCYEPEGGVCVCVWGGGSINTELYGKVVVK